MNNSEPDVIDQLVGVRPGSTLDQIRRSRPDTRKYAQLSYDTLFRAIRPGTPTVTERLALAAFMSLLHSHPAGTEHYTLRLGDLDEAVLDSVRTEALLGKTSGPYGLYPPESALHDEDSEGLRFSVSLEGRRTLGDRLSAGLEHAHMLVFRPREATSADLARLRRSGWSTTDIVTLSQLTGFLAFQLRVVTGLRRLDRMDIQ